MWYEFDILMGTNEEMYGIILYFFKCLSEGRMLINERLVEKGSLFIIQKNQLTCPIFLENCKVLCIKVPSVPSDKYGV
jgi:hypothetical protein